MLERLAVEVAYATAERQVIVPVELPGDSTVEDAILAAEGQLKVAAPLDLDRGVWGQVCPLTRRLNPGDRVELYRPLVKDPRTARRELAAGVSASA